MVKYGIYNLIYVSIRDLHQMYGSVCDLQFSINIDLANL